MREISGKTKKKIIEIAVLILVASLLRLPSFFLSHFNNDELIHLSLAMKIDHYGGDVFKDNYNLWFVEQGVDLKNQLVVMIEGRDRIGTFLNGLLGERSTLSHHPPIVPFLVFLSHRVFANRIDYVANISSNIYVMASNFFLQYYACIIPFVFSISLVLLVYILGKFMFSHRVGLLATYFFSFTPVELLVSNKIWADDINAFFIVLSVILFLTAQKRSKYFYSLCAGFCCGFSIITKMSGVYLIFVILLFHLWQQRTKKISVRNIIDFLFNRNVLYFLVGAFIISAFWVNLYYSKLSFRHTQYYFQVNETWKVVQTWNRYFNVASNRPWFTYLILIPYQFPIYLLSYIFIIWYPFRNQGKLDIKLSASHNFYAQFLIIWVLVVTFFLTLKPGKELRYMLVAYPAIAILSAYCLDGINLLLKNQKDGVSDRLRKIFLFSILLLTLLFALKIAIPIVFFRSDLIPIPF